MWSMLGVQAGLVDELALQLQLQWTGTHLLITKEAMDSPDIYSKIFNIYTAVLKVTKFNIEPNSSISLSEAIPPMHFVICGKRLQYSIQIHIS